MKYEVVITEVYRKPVAVVAGSAEEAHQRVMDAWANGEVTLGLHDAFHGVEFFVKGPAGDDLEKVDRKE